MTTTMQNVSVDKIAAKMNGNVTDNRTTIPSNNSMTDKDEQKNFSQEIEHDETSTDDTVVNLNGNCVTKGKSLQFDQALNGMITKPNSNFADEVEDEVIEKMEYLEDVHYEDENKIETQAENENEPAPEENENATKTLDSTDDFLRYYQLFTQLQSKCIECDQMNVNFRNFRAQVLQQLTGLKAIATTHQINYSDSSTSTSEEEQAETAELVLENQKRLEELQNLQQAYHELESQLRASKQDLVHKNNLFAEFQQTKLQEIRRYEKDFKSYKNKMNQQKVEISKNRKIANSIQQQHELEVENVQRNLDNVTQERDKLLQKLEFIKQKLEEEQRSKLEVSKNNQKFLRDERAKISKQLRKIENDKANLEYHVSDLEQKIQTKTEIINRTKKQIKQTEEKYNQQRTIAQQSSKEKDDAVEKYRQKKLSEKNSKVQCEQYAIENGKLRKTIDNQRQQLQSLSESLRKKAASEKQLKNREKSVKEREKKLAQKSEAVQKQAARMRRQTEKISPSKVSKNKQDSMKSKDPLHILNEMGLPWHWISVLLFVVFFLSMLTRK